MRKRLAEECRRHLLAVQDTVVFLFFAHPLPFYLNMPPKKGAKKKVTPKKAAPKKATPKKAVPKKATPKKDLAKEKEEVEVEEVASDVPVEILDTKVEVAEQVQENKKERQKVQSASVVRGAGEDYIAFYARKYWAMDLQGAGEFDDEVVKEIFNKELSGMGNFARLNMLETSSYLENYLWNNLSSTSSFEHIFSIVLMINEKFREGSPAFDNITESDDKFQDFFKRTVSLSPPLDSTLTMLQQTSLIMFFTNVFQSLENRVVRQCALRYLSLPIWESLTLERLNMELDEYPQIRRHWQHLVETKASPDRVEDTSAAEEEEEASSDRKATPKRGRASTGKKGKEATPKAKKSKVESSSAGVDSRDATWIPGLLQYFLSLVESDSILDSNASDDLTSTIYFLERFCDFLIDLLSQLPTRRFLNTVLDDMHVVVRCKKSALYTSSASKGNLFRQLVDRIDSYSHFEIHDQSGKALSAQDVMAAYNTRLHKVQQVAYGSFPDSLRDVYFSSTGELGKAEKLKSCLALLAPADLMTFANKLGYISTTFRHTDENTSATDFVVEVLLDKLVYRQGQADELSQMSLIPTESLLWNPNLVPLGSKYNGNQVLSLPKLNLQFLTMHDYLLRNFSLFRLESAYEIRQDLQDAIKRMAPRQSLSGSVSFGGWARMALPLRALSIEEVLKPALGEVVPARVSCSVEVDISRFQGAIREEWESLREHDVVFLVCIRNPKTEAGKTANEFEKERSSLARGQKPKQTRDFKWAEEDFDFPETFGVQHVRGGEIFEVRDEDGVVLNDFTKPDERKSGRVGGKRRLRLNLDAAQYYTDMTDGVSCYETLNLLVRRKSKENNFRAILETIRNLMNTAAVGRAVPTWLHDVFLGYGNPSAAHYRNMPGKQVEEAVPSGDARVWEEADYTDTFLDATHLVEAFPDAEVSFQLTPEGKSISLSQKSISAATRAQLRAPFRLKICRPAGGGSARDEVTATPYTQLNMGPFPQDKRPSNTIR
jgi:intron-binding protein aquarius